jgi:hypothetical protein
VACFRAALSVSDIVAAAAGVAANAVALKMTAAITPADDVAIDRGMRRTPLLKTNFSATRPMTTLPMPRSQNIRNIFVGCQA